MPGRRFYKFVVPAVQTFWFAAFTAGFVWYFHGNPNPSPLAVMGAVLFSGFLGASVALAYLKAMGYR